MLEAGAKAIRCSFHYYAKRIEEPPGRFELPTC